MRLSANYLSQTSKRLRSQHLNCCSRPKEGMDYIWQQKQEFAIKMPRRCACRHRYDALCTTEQRKSHRSIRVKSLPGGNRLWASILTPQVTARVMPWEAQVSILVHIIIDQSCSPRVRRWLLEILGSGRRIRYCGSDTSLTVETTGPGRCFLNLRVRSKIPGELN